MLYRLSLQLLGSSGEAADAVQETSVRAWQRIARLRDPAAVTGWLCRICRNHCYDQLRRRKRQKADYEVPAREDPEPDPAAMAASNQGVDEIWRLVGALPEKYRIVLLLHVVEGMTNEEISLALGIAVGTVDSRLHRARKELARKLERLARRTEREYA